MSSEWFAGSSAPSAAPHAPNRHDEDPEPPTAGVVNSIAHTPERLAEAGPLGMVVPLGERDAGLQREIVEVGGTRPAAYRTGPTTAR